jgi:hypothetical protein
MREPLFPQFDEMGGDGALRAQADIVKKRTDVFICSAVV